MSSNVAARRSTLNSATVGVFGIDEGDTLDDSNLEIINSVYEKQDEEPLSFNDKLDKLVNLMEEMHVKSRDNNAILFNMLDKFSGTVNSRIDQVRAELITKIEEASKRSEGFIAKKAVPAKHRPSAYGSQVVTPLPGFVIKTRKLLGEKAKAFINVFYHKDVEFEPGSIPKAQATDKPYFIALEAPSKTEDKEGHVSLLYNIVVSGEYFDQPNLHEDFKITSPNSIQRIIHKVNVRYGDFLDEGSYSLPRVGQGYKGDGEVPQFTIPLLLPNLPEPPASAAARPMQSIPEFPTASLPASSSSSKKDRRGSGTSSVGSGSNRSQSSTPTAGAAAANTSNDANPELAEFTGMGGITAERSDSFNSQFSEMTKDSFAPHHSRSGPLVGSGRRPSHEGSVNGSITGSQKSARRPTQRKSVFDSTKLGYTGGTTMGRNLLSGDMLEFVKEESLDAKGAQTLVANSADNAECLLGWQIQMNDKKYNGIYVVTDMRKNYMQKTEYRVSKFHAEDAWVRLKRENPETKKSHNGYTFRPLRMVLYGLADDDDASVGDW